MRFELLVGARDFWSRAEDDIARAERRVLVQAMSFEGDSAGLAVSRALSASGAGDRRVLVDDYTRLNVNDRSVRSRKGRRDPALQAEVAATARMFRDLAGVGVPVRVTNRVGRFGAGYPARNHKKLIVADDVAYLGGINFCEHNYEWHDFMLRLEGSETADFLAEDFDATFESRVRPARLSLDAMSLHSLDGRTNREAMAPLHDAVARAQREITVLSPYLTFPFTDHLAAARRRGVAVRLITPWASNKTLVRNALLRAARRENFETALLGHMSHLKALLIDDDTLVMGSSNFDFVSLAAEEEFIAVIHSADVIAEFRRRIIAPALADALPGERHRIPPLAGVLSALALRIADPVARAARTWPRTATEWRD